MVADETRSKTAGSYLGKDNLDVVAIFLRKQQDYSIKASLWPGEVKSVKSKQASFKLIWELQLCPSSWIHKYTEIDQGKRKQFRSFL